MFIQTEQETKLPLGRDEILDDYCLAYQSRQVSVVGRREVMSGKAKFGIFGAGKEIAQLGMAKSFKPGDFRSGYYRDQTFMFATGMTTIQEFFAQLYAHADAAADPASGGRSMNAHFASRSLDENGLWRNLAETKNSSADISPTGSQMPRLVGLGYASRLFRELDELHDLKQFSNLGSEVAYGTIGNATCAEGLFWEAINAIGVLRAAVLLTIYDDGYGISVPNQYQLVGANLSQLLSGFQRPSGSDAGFEVYTVRGWDYPAVIETYRRASESVRDEHVPAIVHVIELTQPQGHSTSGSHERYKTKERLAWEQEYDCLNKLREYILGHRLASPEDLEIIDEENRQQVEGDRQRAWRAYQAPIIAERRQATTYAEQLIQSSSHRLELQQVKESLLNIASPLRRNIFSAVHQMLLIARDEDSPARQAILDWKHEQERINIERYDSYLYSQSKDSALRIAVVKPIYSDGSPTVMGFEVLNACFDAALRRDPRIIGFGEDVGRLGDVNQGFRGLQEKYGELRVTDTGIREATIIGQAIGLALRGLRPIAEIQYLDYVLYALQILSDDLATLHWRTAGGQKAPVIVRTRGHRLEGIWHSGSLLAGIVDLVRGMYVLVPRDMTRAAGFYNTLLRSDEPALVVEVLNAYRSKEVVPDNIAEFTLPLGVPETLRTGRDVTLVTYGACCNIVLEAADSLSKAGVEAEVIDVQSLLPFDLQGKIAASVRKTNRVVFIDEDVPGGTTAYMLREVLEKQGGYAWLDSAPMTISGKAHRPAYGSDGDYFSKPNHEVIVESVYALMHEIDPQKFPLFF